MFALGACIVGATELKFSMELGFHPEMVIAKFWASSPHPQGFALKMGSWGPHSPNGAFLGKLS